MIKKFYKYIILFLFSIVSIIFVYNDYFLYNCSIMKVTNITSKIKNTNVVGEKYYIQNVTGIIMNGKFKGNIVEFDNNYSSSLVYDDKIEDNTELLVSLSSDGKKVIRVDNIKRDKYLVILLVIFFDLIILIAGRKGIKTLISLFVNVLISTSAILLFKNNYTKVNMLLLYLFVSIVFIILSLFITNGKSKKTLSAIISSIVSLFLSFGLSYFLIHLYSDDLYIWGLEYIEVVHDYRNFLYVCILLGGLGAIMDISITISSSLNELILKDPNINRKSLLKSGKMISKDIVGTMINVMLFTCYTSVIPTVILAMKNNMTLSSALDFYGSLELTIVLCNCVGIVMTIPISLYISLLILSDKKRNVIKK